MTRKPSRFPVRPDTLVIIVAMVVIFILWGDDIVRYFITGHS